MSDILLAAKVDTRIKKALELFCDQRGLKMNRFIEDAILDKLEEHEDIEDLKKLRHEKAQPFNEVIKELKKHGNL